MDDPSLMPDLSHLSAEERAIIEQVFKRQKDEEEREVQISQKADEELDQIEKQINDRKESARKLVGTQDDAICQICQKTKFADGIGHKCFYCQLRSCARCGGRTQSKNKPIWACSMCQKKQQILAKTGKWFQPDEPVHKLSGGGGGGAQSPCQSLSPVPSTSTPTHHMPPPSTVSNTNGPIQQTTQLQRQQTTQNHQPSMHRQASEAVGMGNGPNGHAPQMQNQQGVQQQQQQQRKGGTMQGDIKRQNTLHRQPSLESEQQLRQQQQQQQQQHVGNGMLPQQRTQQSSSQRNDQRGPEIMGTGGEYRQDKTLQLNEQPRNRSISTIETTKTPRIDDERKHSVMPRAVPPDTNIRNEPRPGPFDPRYNEFNTGIPPSSASTSTNPEFRRTRSIKEEESRRGSIGVRLKTNEDIVITHAHAQQHARNKKSRLHRQLRSMSSSEDDIPSTSLTGDDAVQRVPNECSTEKDLLKYIYASEKLKPNGRKTGAVVGGAFRVENSRSPLKTSIIPGDMLAAKIRNYLSHPVTWQPSADQRRLIGHMILHRTDSSTNGDLGLKVVGGRRSDTGRLGAFVTRVKPSSVADTIGKLRPGDEVLEWNGEPLQNATFDQVYDIISSSKHQTQVELIVSRSSNVPGGDDFLNVSTSRRELPNPQYLYSHQVEGGGDLIYSPCVSPLLHSNVLSHSQSAILHHNTQSNSPRHRSSMAAFYPDMPGPIINQTAPLCHGKGQIFGRIELCLFYSHHDRQLTVTIDRAMDISPRPDGFSRNPYVKLFLLPDRSERSRRQSSVLAETLQPVWSESFYYHGLTEPMLMERVLEVTVWDYDKYETNSFLGETLIDLSTCALDGIPMSYTLVDMDDENPLRTRLRLRKLSQYSGGQQRPRSEMGYGAVSIQSSYHNDYYQDRNDYGRNDGYDGRRDKRRSRVDDRSYNMTHHRPDEDWTHNAQSGYLSDHGLIQPHGPRHRHRRPRSATAMRPMTAAEMSASRLYNRIDPQWEDEQQERYHTSKGNNIYPSDHPNGRVVVDMIQEQQTGYGSDGSETLSIQSAHSMQPQTRTINRRCPVPNGGDQEDNLMEDYQDDTIVMEPQSKGSVGQQQAIKERKKSLMTRFIPGRAAAGAEAKRTGFARSEEVGIPGNLSVERPFLKQTSKESTDSDWLPVLPEGPLGTFVDNLGPGQVVGRQVLASPVLGEIQIGIMAGRSGIDVEIIRAKNLAVRPNIKMNPAPYVKVYLMEGKQCIAKAKTNPVRKTINPLFQQHLIFNDTPKNKMLQVTVLGDYGRLERKAFMGIVQIRLDDLQLGAEPVIGWYKLYHFSSLAGTGPVRKDSETSLLGAQ